MLEPTSPGQRIKIATDIRHHRTIAAAIDTAGEWLVFFRELWEKAGQGQEAGSADPWGEETGEDGAWLN